MTQQNDNAVMHLLEMEMPGIALNATDGTIVDLGGRGLSVVYAYPRISPPGDCLFTPGVAGSLKQLKASKLFHVIGVFLLYADALTMRGEAVPSPIGTTAAGHIL